MNNDTRNDTLLTGLAQARVVYDRLRGEIETPQNVGRLVSIDVETGNHAVGDDTSFAAPRSLRTRNPHADVVTLRIGYNAVYALGGVLERTAA